MSLFNKVTQSFQWGRHQVTMETGEIARQSNGAVVVDIEGTVVLATVVARTAVPSMSTTTAPDDWRAISPVSIVTWC